MATKKGQSMKAPGKQGYGVKGDPHAPKLPPIKGPGKSNQLPAKPRRGK